MKNFRGITLPLQNWNEEFNEFWLKDSKISKICTLMGCFCLNYKVFELNKFRGVIFNDTGMSNLTNFDSSTWKSKKKCTLMGCIWPKDKIFELKKYRGVMFDGTEYRCKVWLKTDLCFEKWYENIPINHCYWSIDIFWLLRKL